MQTANDTLNTVESKLQSTVTSFEMSKNEEESLLQQPSPPQQQQQKVAVESEAQLQQPRIDMKQIIDRIKESKSIKLNLYRDILVNQFTTINKQRSQLKDEMIELHNLLTKMQNGNQN
jgi:hypothetical protein